jgi:hypothetical protein
MTFRRVMFWALVPAVALMAEGLSALFFLAHPSQLSTVLFFAVFGYVLLGSMTLNAWLALRHPSSLERRELPLKLAVVHAVLYACAASWLVAGWQATNRSQGFVTGWPLPVNLAFWLCIPLMGLSVAALVLILRRPTVAAERRPPGPISMRAAFGLSAFIVLAAATVSTYLLMRTPDNDGFFTFTLMLMGLPWSHTQYLVIDVPLAFAGQQPIITSTLIAPIAVNVALALALLLSARFRSAATNGFFRLDRTPKPDLDALAEDGA